MASKPRKKPSADFKETAEEYHQKKKTLIRDILGSKLDFKPKTENQKLLLKSFRENDITICDAPPGCGKTFLALAEALNLLMSDDNRFYQIILVKSVLQLDNEELGFIKGDLNAKMEGPIMSFMINMGLMIEESTIKNLVEASIIKVIPLAFFRGLSLQNSIIIADEIQNITLQNARTILTRIGQNSAIFMLGDKKQSDLPRSQRKESSLAVLMDLFTDVPKIGVVQMFTQDIVRHPLISLIENKFDAYYDQQITPVKPKRNQNG